VPTAVVLGSNGQDGSYLSEVLLASGLDVVGVARQAESRWVKSHPRFRHACVDVADAGALKELLRETRPDRDSSVVLRLMGSMSRCGS
jgi:GDPmannose 4,6-dehydratase